MASEVAIEQIQTGPAGDYPPDARIFSGIAALRLSIVAVIVLTAVGGLLRFYATSFGLPDKFRPDEEYMISRALGFEHDWNPHFALYPAAQMYVEHEALWVYGVLKGYRHNNFRDAYASDFQALAYLVARRLSAAMGTATIPVVYLAGAAGFGTGAGVGAAAIMTFTTLDVRDSKYATADAATVLWLSMALWLMLRMVRRGWPRDYLLAGAATGLAIASKYPAGAIVFGLTVAHLEARRREGKSLWKALFDARIYLVGAATAVVFFCFTPYLFLDWAQTVRDYQYQRGFILNGVNNPQASYGWGWLWLRAMPESFGLALQVLLAVAMLWALVRPRPGTLSLLVFLAVAFWGEASSHYVFYRYLLIPLPAMALLGGLLVSDLRAWLATLLGSRTAAACAAIGLALVLLPDVVRDIQLDHLLAQPDTRTLAREWIAAHVPPGSAIAATDVYTPYGKPQLDWRFHLVPFTTVAMLRAAHVQWVVSDSFPPLAYYSRGPTPLQLAQLRTQAVLMFDARSLKPGATPPLFDANDAFYAPLIHITSMSRPGPEMRIWKLK